VRPVNPDPLKVAAELGGAIPKHGAIATPDELRKKIQSASAADLKYAKAVADAVGSPGAKLRSACYGAWITTIEQAQGVGLMDAGGNPLTQPSRTCFRRSSSLPRSPKRCSRPGR
jgi:hypothetical protein